MNKNDRDNRANQMNPNNPKYWKSRGYASGKPSGKSKNRPQTKTVIIRESRPRNAGYACPICGRRGALTALDSYGFQMQCGWCNGRFFNHNRR